MKKIFGLLFVFCASLMFVSCLSDNSKDIEKLIASRDYDKAREIAIAEFSDYGGHNNVQSLKLYQIAKAQIEEIFVDGDYKEAYEVARETKQPFAFQDVFAENVNNVLRKGNYDFIFKVLGEWKIYCEYNETLSDLVKNEDFLLKEPSRDDDYIKTDAHQTSWESNGPYNADVRRFNSIVDKVLEACVEEKDAGNIKECLKLYMPYAALDSKKDTGEKCIDENYYLFTYKLQNTAKDEAQQRVADAGIEL